MNTEIGRIRRRAYLGLLPAFALLPKARAQSSSSNQPEFLFTDFGAKGDGVTDNGPALSAALSALSQAGGGELDIPPGQYVLATPASQDFRTTASSIIIRGFGSSSQFIIKMSNSATAITLHNLDSVLLDNLVFVGTPGVLTDALVTLQFSFCTQAIIRCCNFYGISSIQNSGGAVVYSYHTDLRVENSGFRGCTGNSALANPVIQNQSWTGLTVTGCDFIDWGYINGQYISKTPLAVGGGWIYVGDTLPLISSTQMRAVHISDCRMDEGSFYGLHVRPSPTTTRAMAIDVSDLMVNVSGAHQGVGIRIQHASRVRIKDSWLGYTKTPNAAVTLYDAGNAVLDNVVCAPQASTINADSTTTSLTLIECTYTTLNSSAGYTGIIKNGQRTQ
jgi:hypothetical protein